METGLLVKQFARMGARIQLREIVNDTRRRRTSAGIDIRSDERGEFFDIRIERGERVEYEVVDLRPELRHLLLLGRRGGVKEKYLCGHDERHWFVCAVPGASVSGVATAFEALQPFDERWVARHLRRQKNRFRRRNEAFVRQGEWFFVPDPDIVVPEWLLLRNEPLSRGAGSKPHVCQFAYRTGGVLVWVCPRFPTGVTVEQYANIVEREPKARHWGWRQFVRDAGVYARGTVRHSDHKTVVLDGWHRVSMNTEREAPFAPRVAFLD
ncbi:MAG: hypothetical protein JOZ02_07540 [Acidobacteria bacterium]|nr:hypothetical protein [Acidobacteriota bacterium]